MPPFWVGFSKQRKKPGVRRSSNCVQNACFRLSPSGRNEKTPLESNSTMSVSYHHFGWAFPSSAKSRVDEGRPIALKTRFFDFPHRGETKKHPWNRIPQRRFHTTILGGLFQAAQKAGLTNVQYSFHNYLMKSTGMQLSNENNIVDDRKGKRSLSNLVTFSGGIFALLKRQVSRNVRKQFSYFAHLSGGHRETRLLARSPARCRADLYDVTKKHEIETIFWPVAIAFAHQYWNVYGSLILKNVKGRFTCVKSLTPHPPDIGYTGCGGTASSLY